MIEYNRTIDLVCSAGGKENTIRIMCSMKHNIGCDWNIYISCSFRND